MSKKNIIIDLIIISIIGILLGIITEYALILNIDWLIKITQSFRVWGIVMCVVALCSKKYILSILNPSILMTAMSLSYYTVRMIKFGSTHPEGLNLFIVTGIAGSMYLGTIVYLIKEKFFLKHKPEKLAKNALIFMTIVMIPLTIYDLFNYLFHNLFYAMDLGIFIGFILGLIVTKITNTKRKNETFT